MTGLKVGSTIWQHDENAGRGRHEDLTQAERLRLKFVENTIFGETSRSWLVGKWSANIKVNKKDFTYVHWGGGRNRMFISPKEVDDYIFLHAHGHRIAKAVQDSGDVELLREVARVIGYEERN